MKLHALNFPDDPTKWGNWLDNLMISEEFASTVFELKAIAGGTSSEGTDLLSDVLDKNEIDSIRSKGFSSIDPDKCRRLVAHPDLLLEIEEQIFELPSSFWIERMAVASDVPPFEEIRERIPDFPDKVSAASNSPTVQASSTRRSFLTWGAIVAVAASALFVMWLRNPTATKGWGFNKPGMLVADISEADMLERLEGLADEWYKKTPDTKASLAERLNQYRVGCQTLLDARLPQLSDTSRKRVKAACLKCKTDIAAHLKALGNGADFGEIQVAANASIDELKRSIREAG